MEEAAASRSDSMRRLREFLRNYRRGAVYPYREQLLQRWRKKEAWLEVELGDLNQYDSSLLAQLQSRPTEYLALFEQAAQEVLQRLAGDDEDGEGEDDLAAGTPAPARMPRVQVVLRSDQQTQSLRGLTAEHVNQLLKVPGIIVSASRVKPKATVIQVVCKTCGNRKVRGAARVARRVSPHPRAHPPRRPSRATARSRASSCRTCATPPRSRPARAGCSRSASTPPRAPSSTSRPSSSKRCPRWCRPERCRAPFCWYVLGRRVTNGREWRRIWSS